MSKPKKPAKMAHRNVGVTSTIKDDGVRYRVVNVAGKPVYGGEGIVLAEAVRLATTLVATSGVSQVQEDGSLLPGTVSAAGEFVPVAR